MSKEKKAPSRKPFPDSPWRKRLVELRDLLAVDGERLTQADAAKRIGVAMSTWRAWENGFRVPREATVRLINLTFGTAFPLTD